MRNAVIPALLALALAPASLAAGEKPAAGKAADAKPGEVKKGRPGTNIPLETLLAPLTNEEGKLTGYAYLSSRLSAASERDALAAREKLPFIQDAMLRDVNAEAVSTPDDPEKVDIAGVEKRLLSDAAKVMGPGKVKAITICTVQVAPLHPVQTPALYTPPEEVAAHGPAPKNPVKSRCED